MYLYLSVVYAPISMKKILFLLVYCSFVAPLSAQTSVYHPFPDSSASWNYTHGNLCWGPIGVDLISYQHSYYIGADTMINNAVYHSLQIPVVLYSAGPNCWPSGNYTLPGKYAGAFRNDHFNRKVYIVPENDSVEQLLYDFNLQVGDSLLGYLPVCFSICDTVISIDSVLVGNTYRKRWLVDQMYQAYIIEGVGSTYGLIDKIYANAVDLDGITLDCFLQNNQPQYPDTIGSCAVLTSVPSVSNSETIVKVSPNPSHDRFFTEVISSNSCSRISIHQFTGQIVLDMVGAQHKVEITGLTPGIYFITFYLEDGRTITRKQVVI